MVEQIELYILLKCAATNKITAVTAHVAIQLDVIDEQTIRILEKTSTYMLTGSVRMMTVADCLLPRLFGNK